MLKLILLTQCKVTPRLMHVSLLVIQAKTKGQLTAVHLAGLRPVP
jgi:hypothetical protein